MLSHAYVNRSTPALRPQATPALKEADQRKGTQLSKGCYCTDEFRMYRFKVGDRVRRVCIGWGYGCCAVTPDTH